MLGDAINLKRGYDLPERDRVDGKFPIISSSGVTGYHNVAKIKGAGVVTGRYGTLGQVFYVRTDFWPLNTSLYVQDFKGNNPLFISYFLRTLNFGQRSGAAAVPGINRNDLHRLNVRMPDLGIQLKIAAVLSSYDDLIENNLRRIKILEDMAQNLYREWFVKFRYPDHERGCFVDSPLGRIPKGWKTCLVKDVLSRRAAGIVYQEGGFMNEGIVPIYDQSTKELLGFHNNGPDHLASPGEPIAIFGDHTCKMQLLIEPFSIGPNVIPFTATDQPLTTYIFQLVRNLIHTEEYKRHWTSLIGKEIVVADRATALNYVKITQPILAKQEVLRKTNRCLRRTRDLMLPKLISGEIDVTNLDIAIPEEIAA